MWSRREGYGRSEVAAHIDGASRADDVLVAVGAAPSVGACSDPVVAPAVVGLHPMVLSAQRSEVAAAGRTAVSVRGSMVEVAVLSARLAVGEGALLVDERGLTPLPGGRDIAGCLDVFGQVDHDDRPDDRAGGGGPLLEAFDAGQAARVSEAHQAGSGQFPRVGVDDQLDDPGSSGDVVEGT